MTTITEKINSLTSSVGNLNDSLKESHSNISKLNQEAQSFSDNLESASEKAKSLSGIPAPVLADPKALYQSDIEGLLQSSTRLAESGNANQAIAQLRQYVEQQQKSLDLTRQGIQQTDERILAEKQEMAQRIARDDAIFNDPTSSKSAKHHAAVDRGIAGSDVSAAEDTKARLVDQETKMLKEQDIIQNLINQISNRQIAPKSNHTLNLNIGGQSIRLNTEQDLDAFMRALEDAKRTHL